MRSKILPVSSEDGTVRLSTREMMEGTPYSLRVQGKDCRIVKRRDGAIEIYELRNSPNWPLLTAIAIIVAGVIYLRWSVRSFNRSRLP
ncbi:MAG: hypothetical protein Q8O75_03595 [bacterium]|nr:hypothetical protein [bacterium]